MGHSVDSWSPATSGFEINFDSQESLCLKGGFTEPLGLRQYTWHTSLDTYEHIIEDDAETSAIVIAATVYQLAMMDEMLPRFGKDDMPLLPKPTPETPAAAQPRPTTIQ